VGEAREELDYCLFKANARREEMSSLRQAPALLELQ